MGIVDVNGDNKLDIIVGNIDQNIITIFFNSGNGIFNNHTNYPSADIGFKIKTADMNNDNKSDIIITGGSNKFGLYYNIGNGTFTSEKIILTKLRISDLAIADVNGDNKLDFIIISIDESIVIICFQTTDGLFDKEA
ncbi:unnamed protein product, partial [Rotaria sp. Silwood1]